MLHTFRLRRQEGENKVCPLPQAIQENVRPGMAVYATRLASAQVLELSRQFWGTRPGFTLISSVTTGYHVVPIIGGLVKKVITTNCTNFYPTPGPLPPIQQAHRRGELEIEGWSLYTLEQRLMAGALGLGFLPTRSLLGSDIGRENKHAFREIEDPFGGPSLGAVKALVPDVGLVHAWAADPYGNTILPPLYEELWGARAAERIVVSVEKVVSTDFIRRHAPLVKIPGYLVSAVCPVPMGAHPWGLPRYPGMASYAEDYPFLLDLRQACQEPGALAAWVEEWVLKTGTHQAYLSKLGNERASRLRERARRGREEIPVPPRDSWNPEEMMVVAAAREIQARVKAQGYRTILSGVGTGALAAWLSYYLLQEKGYGLALMVGAGEVGFSPRPGEACLLDIAHMTTAKMVTDVSEVYGWIVAGRRSQCLSVLGAAMIDKYGNVNSTRTNGRYLIGSGGANDAANAPEVLAVVRQSRERFLDRVAFITAPGKNLRTLVSQLGVFQKDERGELVLTHLLPSPAGISLEERVKQARDNCGWELRVAPQVTEVAPPTPKELLILRHLDARGFFIGG